MTSQTFETWYREFPVNAADFKPGIKPQSSGQVHYRYIELDHTRAQDDQRTIEATLSTETPVARRGYREILRHTDDAVNLERASGGTLPLLWSHNQEQQIGVAENVRVYQGRLRARLRFSKSKRGEEVWNDVVAGIVRGLSIGYYVEDTTENTEQEEYDQELIATRWTPFEASCVACPADLSAGIDRAFDGGSLRETPPEYADLSRQYRLHKQYKMMIEAAPEQLPGFRAEIQNIQERILAANTEKDVRECIQLTRKAHINMLAAEDDANDTVGLITTTSPSGRSNPMEQFSLCRAIALTFDPSSIKTGGPELEVMQQTAKSLGKRSGERHTLPEEAIFRSINKAGDGQNLIGMSHSPDMFIQALRARLITGRMGATILPGLTSDISVPRQTDDSTATWLAGDGSDQVQPSDPSFDKIVMRPTSVGVSSTISRKMLLQGDPASDQLVRESLAYAVAKAIDKAAINGTGASNEPLGILGQTGVDSNTYANGGLPTFGQIVDMEGALMNADADVGNLGYITTGALASKLKQTEVVATTGQMIWTATGEGEGRMSGHRALTSNLLPAGHLLFGNWNDLIVGMWSGLDFVVDPYTRASYGDVIITVFTDCDIAVRHGESFSELHEA